MKNLLLIIGILIIIIGVMLLLFSALQGYGYYHLLDGDADMYLGLRRRMIRFLAIGVVLVVIGAACMIILR